jgi:hypothetical protein
LAKLRIVKLRNAVNLLETPVQVISKEQPLPERFIRPLP